MYMYMYTQNAFDKITSKGVMYACICKGNDQLRCYCITGDMYCWGKGNKF